ncbi:hypothetical protein GCM10009804_25820 [Kribbella hippodromi]|uniref:Uncharacterized protein n=1 Tax=Kribbella hippodromi TaxID=434347 RepID=A0ABN2D4C1_9ACTN
MSPRAVDKRARPGNEQHAIRPPAPETPSAITVLAAADHSVNRISRQKPPPAKAS